ncbi:MAG: nuclease-related domain-containing protein [bacterium]
MVATLQALRPPRAMRWVNYWRGITAGLVFLGLLSLLFLKPRFLGIPHFFGILLTLIFWGFAIWSYGIARHRGRIVGEGSEGEAMVAKVIDGLPMDARVLHSVQFESGEKTRELDHLLITHNVMFVIETKYLRGRIVGDVMDREWTLHKRARKTRSRYKRGFYNPLKQVATQIYHLRSHLETNLNDRWAHECSQIWIQGVVVFAHPQGDSSAVVNHAHGVVSLDDLPKYLANYRAPSRARRLSYGLRREICRVLTGH